MFIDRERLEITHSFRSAMSRASVSRKAVGVGRSNSKKRAPYEHGTPPE